jgi:hypothetical protein
VGHPASFHPNEQARRGPRFADAVFDAGTEVPAYLIKAAVSGIVRLRSGEAE